MSWRPIQALSETERIPIVQRINACLGDYKKFCVDGPRVNFISVPQNSNDTRIICFHVIGDRIKSIFQCMRSKNLNIQGSICLCKNENGEIVFARQMKFNNGQNLFKKNGGRDFYRTHLARYFDQQVTSDGDNWKMHDIVGNAVDESTRFVLFGLESLRPEEQKHQSLKFVELQRRLEAFLRAQEFVCGGDEGGGTEDDDTIREEPMIATIRKALGTYRNVILEGVPGTGKTWYARELSVWRQNDSQQGDDKFVARWITFHPAVAYEDFVEGIRPGAGQSHPKAEMLYFWENCETAEGAGFAVRDGFFLRVCQEACRNPRRRYLVVIDEINRANLPNVLGDLLTLLEKDKRVRFDDAGKPVETSEENWVTLPYSGRRFAVPDNVYFLGTMNTSDKSIAPIDAALRRRFAFLSIEPMPAPELCAKVPPDVHPSVEKWDRLNGLLADCLGPDGRLGHSYLLQLGERIRSSNGIAPEEAIRLAWQLELLPQLIDTLTTHGAIELFAADDGCAWLGARDQQAGADHGMVKNFRDFIKSLGFELVLQGDGHGKGLRVVPMGAKTEDLAGAAVLPAAAE